MGSGRSAGQLRKMTRDVFASGGLHVVKGGRSAQGVRTVRPSNFKFVQRRCLPECSEYLNGGQSARTQFSRELSVTASLGPPSINRGCGRPFEVAEHLGDLVSMCESA